MTNQDKNVQINIPKDLAEQIQKKIEGTEFDSVSNYVTYVMKQVLKANQDKTKEKKELTKEEEDKIKKNLHSMGYL
ncbi:MAG TPA: CopG family transcriptional regulator [Candidatus Nanoarchaeia archaeon]|nr:CopG family transcriptional regulator [Candidatus Nanoarchaeia archaeon]